MDFYLSLILLKNLFKEIMRTDDRQRFVILSPLQLESAVFMMPDLFLQSTVHGGFFLELCSTEQCD
jgi:hypothetical protein